MAQREERNIDANHNAMEVDHTGERLEESLRFTLTGSQGELGIVG